MRLVRFVVLASVIAALPSCMLTRVVDRAFLGASVSHPKYEERKMTGVFLVPFTFAVDAATLPIQAILLVILGDEFPFGSSSHTSGATAMIQTAPQYLALSADARRVADQELETIFASGALTPNASLVLTADGHWQVITLDNETRAQLLVRVSTPAPAPVAVCAR